MALTTRAREPETTHNDTGLALEIRNLSLELPAADGPVRLLDDVSLSIPRGSVRGLIGESGSGKTMTALSVVGLQPPGAQIVSGSIKIAGEEVVGASDAQMRRIRGQRVGFIFQDPMTSLNPMLSIGFQIKESLRAHKIATGKRADARAVELLDLMGIANARARLKQYPHEFSGGMRQRIVIAMALACNPDLLLADEPTTALDVTIQSQILDLIQGLSDDLGVACLWITHDLGVAAALCQDVSVMYGGQIVESGPIEAVFAQPQMPYTTALIGALPRIDQEGPERLAALPGAPPLPVRDRTHCGFADRCPQVRDVCWTSIPELSPRAAKSIEARCLATEQGGWLASGRPTS